MAMRQDASTGEMVETPEAEGEAGKEVIDPKKPTMDVKVYAPFKIYYEGKAVSISGENETGPFDILPHHKNFLCMLIPCEMKIRTPYEGGDKTIKIPRALMHVKADRVVVFVDV